MRPAHEDRWARALRRRLTAAGLAAVALSLAAGCSSTPDADGSAASPPVTGASHSTGEYLPGLEADVYLPPGPVGADPAPVVLLVPGGGWTTADRRGLEPLAAVLADEGFVAVNATYGAGPDVTFPRPVEDVLCAAGYAAQAARAAGIDLGPMVVAGHSAGGHIAALAALGSIESSTTCPYPVASIDGLIGMAGVYDTSAFEFALVEFFGGPPTALPEVWGLGDPIGLVMAGRAPAGLKVLLLHGDADEVVPVDQSRAFESALVGTGTPVRLDVVPGATHDTIYSPVEVAAVATEWIRDLG